MIDWFVRAPVNPHQKIAFFLSFTFSLCTALGVSRASAWYAVHWGFIPDRVTLKTLKIVLAAFAPGA